MTDGLDTELVYKFKTPMVGHLVYRGETFGVYF